MSQNFQAGDFLIFQIESGFGLLRLLAIEEYDGAAVWHIAGYEDLFPDPETLDIALSSPEKLKIDLPHAALTTRAFEATQVARMLNVPLTEEELSAYKEWQNSPEREISDRSVRLMLGLR